MFDFEAGMTYEDKVRLSDDVKHQLDMAGQKFFRATMDLHKAVYDLQSFSSQFTDMYGSRKEYKDMINLQAIDRVIERFENAKREIKRFEKEFSDDFDQMHDEILNISSKD
jgi:predicted transcriptional regulator